MTQSVDAGRIAAYGVGDFGFNLFFTGLNLFLLFYYTNVVRIDPAVAGIMIGIPVLWDALTDPLMGWIAPRFRSRWGLYRPYLIVGAPLASVAFVAMFAAPVCFPEQVIVASVVAHILFRTFYTVANVPYTALSAAMTAETDTRSLLAGARMLFGLSAGLLTAMLTLPLSQYLGDGDMTRGFLYVAIIYATLATAAVLTTYAHTQETIPHQTASLSTRATLRFLKQNKAFWLLACAIFIGSMSSTIATNSINYYVEDVVGAPGQQGDVLFAMLGMIVLSIPFWTWLSQRFGKATVWLTAGIPGVVLGLVMYFLGPETLSTLIVLQLVNGFFAGATPVMMWSMVPDTVEYGEWRSGVRDEAIGFGVIQLALKAANALGISLVGFLLSGFGYVPFAEREAGLGPETLEGLRLMSFLLPSILSVFSLMVIYMYPVDAKLHSRLRLALAWRANR